MPCSPLPRRLLLGLSLIAAFNLGVFARPLIDDLRHTDALQLLQSAARITQPGNERAPQIYVAFDPYCRFCHVLYRSLSKRVAAGEVRVEWVPVAFMDTASAATAARLLSAADPADALSGWFGSSANISPSALQKSDVAGARASIDTNTELIRHLVGRDAAPAVFYRDRSGTARLVVGVPADFDLWLETLSS